MIGKNLFIFAISILISSNLCIAAAQSAWEDQQPNNNYVELLIRKCFTVQEENADITYNPNNILQYLNRQAGVPLFNPSNNGLKINSNVFSSLLINCLKSNADKLLTNTKIQEDFSKIITQKKDELSAILNVLLYNHEISLQTIESLINQRTKTRSKRAAEFPLNIIQELLLNLVIEPLKYNLSNILNSASTAFKSLLVPSENISNDPIQSVVVQSTNSVLNVIIYLISDVQTRVNVFFDSLNFNNASSVSNSTTPSNTLERSIARDLAFPFNIISNMLETTIVGPIRNTVNNILITLNTTFNSLYTTANSDNPVQNVLNNVVNQAVTNIVSVINAIYAQTNSALNGISGANFTTTV